jgi:PAS domain S-box-containing protein
VKLSRKLVLSLLAVSLPVVLGSLAATMLIQGKLERLGGFETDNLHVAQAIGMETLAGVEESYSYVASGLEKEKESFLAWTRRFPARMEQLARTAHLDRPDQMLERDLYQRILSEHEAMAENAKAMFREFESEGRLSRAGFERYEGAVNRLRGAIDSYIRHEELEVVESQAQAVGAIRWSEAVIVSVAALSTILLIVAGFALSRAIFKPILRLQSATRRIEEGNFDVEIASDSRDEIGDLARSVASMVQDLKRRQEELAGANAGLVRQAEELRGSEEKFREMAEHIDQVFWITTPDLGKILYISPGYEKIWGRSTAELAEHPESWAESIHPDDRERVWQLASNHQVTGEYEATFRIIRPDGSLRWVYDHGKGIRNEKGEVIRLVGSVVDITNLKAVEEELIRSNEELQRFAYVASHDLQEPLRSVSSFLQLLQRKYKGKLDSDADEFIGFAVDGAHRMKRLIGDLLAYSRIDNEAKPLEAAALDSALDVALENLKGAIQESGATIARDPLPTVGGDAAQIAQVFQNLIGNAIKFRGERALEIRIGAEKTDSGWTVHVRDNGIGIESQYAERIFVIFQRLHGQRYPGSGIGLSICKKIIERHKGRIWMDSMPGAGTTFHFTLPDSVKGATVKAATPQAPRRVLVVDDDVLVCKLIRKNLEPMGMIVEEAHTGPEGLEAARRVKPDVLFLDVNLPVQDGNQVRRALKEDPATRGIPVIMITCESDLLDPDIAKSEDWLSKPLSMTKLRRRAQAPVPSNS